MRIHVCIELESSDMELLIKASRVLGMPIDAIIKTAIAQYLTRAISTHIAKGREEAGKQPGG